MHHRYFRLSRTETGSIDESQSANIEFRIFTDADNGITTEGSTRDIEIRLGLTQTGNYFDPAPDPTDPRTITLPAGQSSVSGVSPTDDTIDEADGSITVTILDDDSANSPPHYTIGAVGTDDHAPTPIEVAVTDNDDAPVIHVRKTPDFYLREGQPASLQFYIFTGDHEGTTYTTTESEFDVTFPVVITDTSETVTYDDNGTMMTIGTFIDPTSLPTASLTIDAGETTIDQSITFDDDDIDEPHGRFTVVVTEDDGDTDNSEGRYQSITTTTAEAFRVMDNDVPPVIQVTRTATTPIDESGATDADRTATFTYSIFTDSDNPTTRSSREIPIQVGLSQENGIFFTPLDSEEPGEVNNADTPIIVTLAGGALTVDNDIIVPTNTVDEIDGSFTVQVLADADSRATPYYTVSEDTNSVTVDVMDDDGTPEIIAAVVSATGVEEGQPTITFSVDTTNGTTTAAGRDIEIQYTITETDGDFFGIEEPATAGDPKEKTDTVTLKAGQTSVMGVIPLEDTIDEDNGTFNVQLEANTDNPTHYTIPANYASIDGVIVMDDDAPPVIHPVIQTYTEGETTIAFEVYTDEFGEVSTTASAKEIKFNVAIAETSTGGADFIADDITTPIEGVILPARMSRTTTNVTFVEDMIDEINGSFTCINCG